MTWLYALDVFCLPIAASGPFIGMAFSDWVSPAQRNGGHSLLRDWLGFSGFLLAIAGACLAALVWAFLVACLVQGTWSP